MRKTDVSIFQDSLIKGNGALDERFNCLFQLGNSTCSEGPKLCQDIVKCWITEHNRINSFNTNGTLLSDKNTISWDSVISNISRFCQPNETWNLEESLIDYTSCLFPNNNTPDGDHLIAMKEMIRYTLFIGSLSSLLFLFTALYLFSRFKVFIAHGATYCEPFKRYKEGKLQEFPHYRRMEWFGIIRAIRCNRITIHMHLMTALALKCCVLILISDPTSFSEKYYYRNVDWICKLVILVQLYTYLASVNWMCIQGHYLNSKSSTDIFERRQGLKFYYLFGWGFPLIFVLPWLVAMRIHHDVPCWRKYSELKLIWIIVVPMFIILLINLAFLVNIIRVLIQKARITTHIVELTHCKRASKATAILFPLLGINNLIFFFNPGGSWVVYYMMTNAILQPLQGILVSIFHCFCCQDIRDCIRREYWRFSTRRNVNSSIKYNSRRNFVTLHFRRKPPDSEESLGNVDNALLETGPTTV